MTTIFTQNDNQGPFWVKKVVILKILPFRYVKRPKSRAFRQKLKLQIKLMYSIKEIVYHILYTDMNEGTQEFIEA